MFVVITDLFYGREWSEFLLSLQTCSTVVSGVSVCCHYRLVLRSLVE